MRSRFRQLQFQVPVGERQISSRFRLLPIYKDNSAALQQTGDPDERHKGDKDMPSNKDIASNKHIQFHLQLSQSQPNNRWLKVKLTQSKKYIPPFASVPPGPGPGSAFVAWTNFMSNKLITNWGTWKYGWSTVSAKPGNKIDPDASYIGDAPPDKRLWAYGNGHLMLVQFNNLTGGLDTGVEVVVDLDRVPISDLDGAGDSDGKGSFWGNSNLFKSATPILPPPDQKDRRVRYQPAPVDWKMIDEDTFEAPVP